MKKLYLLTSVLCLFPLFYLSCDSNVCEGHPDCEPGFYCSKSKECIQDCQQHADCQPNFLCNLRGRCSPMKSIQTNDGTSLEQDSEPSRDGDASSKEDVPDITHHQETLKPSCRAGEKRSCQQTTPRQGVCKQSWQECNQGTWGACQSESSPSKEECDDKDNDCDGQTDEGLIRECGSNVGECKKGVQACDGGAWTSCKGEKKATTEVCNGRDDDCDGSTDEGMNCSCNHGTTRSCGFDKGECKKGQQTCQGGTWSKCEGGVRFIKEVCDGKDNDCDGQTDEDFLLDFSCSIGKGECKKKGKKACSADKTTTICIGTPGATATEICDGKDNDCDGQTDEGITQPCSTNIGECKQGVQTCVFGFWGECKGGKFPEFDRCNGKDDDCDGQVDELYSLVGKTCSLGTGNCKKTGVYNCKSDGLGVLCNAQAAKPSTEICDGKDNDCDGQTDEGCQCTSQQTKSCGSNVGECKTGTQTCNQQGQWGSCIGEVKASTETCDGKDNDCDGQIDEGTNCNAQPWGDCRNKGCPNGYICMEPEPGHVSICLRTCSQNSLCPSGQTCWPLSGGGGACMKENCTKDSDCLLGTTPMYCDKRFQTNLCLSQQITGTLGTGEACDETKSNMRCKQGLFCTELSRSKKKFCVERCKTTCSKSGETCTKTYFAGGDYENICLRTCSQSFQCPQGLSCMRSNRFSGGRCY